MKRDDLGIKILLVILAILVGISIYLTLRDRGLVRVEVSQSIADIRRSIDSIKMEQNFSPVINTEKGDTGADGRNGADGRDGVDGKDGKESVSTHTVETIIKEVPVNGINGSTPIIRCNETKNRWEISYIEVSVWSIMYGVNGTPVKCVGAL